jgi:hypothetical protein
MWALGIGCAGARIPSGREWVAVVARPISTTNAQPPMLNA